MDEKEIEQKKEILSEKISSLSKDKYSVALIAILALSFIVRFYFFLKSNTQAHWWDSLAFGSVAKNLVYHSWGESSFIAHESVIRPPVLTLLWYVFLKIHASEALTIFFIEIIPSVLSVLLVYLIAKEIFNKKTALISAAILAFSWIHLFYSMRIMSDVLSLTFCLVSIYCFIRSYEDFHSKYFVLAIFFISLAILTRYFYGLIGMIYLLFVIFKHRLQLIKNKKFWVGGIIGSIPLLVFFLVNLINYGGLLPATEIYAASTTGKPVGYYVFNFLPYILGKLLLIAFIIGLLLLIFELVAGFGTIRKSKKLGLYGLLLLILIFPTIFFVFILRAAEDRYWFLAFPAIIILTASAISTLFEYSKKYSKYFAFLLVALILAFSAYTQLTFAKNLIEDKKHSYAQMKEAFLWIKDNTPQDAVLLGDGIDPYAIYYSERKLVIHNETNIEEVSKMADYIILHRFEHQGPELINFVNNHTTSDLTPVKAVFFDAEQTTPAVIIYKVEKS